MQRGADDAPLEAEVEEWAEHHPGCWGPLIDLFDERSGKALSHEDVLAIGKCLGWEDA